MDRFINPTCNYIGILDRRGTIDYPTMAEVESADYEQIYRWFLGLPIPRIIKVGKGKDAKYVYSPGDVQKLLDRIYIRWLEFGGHDKDISDKILKVIK